MPPWCARGSLGVGGETGEGAVRAVGLTTGVCGGIAERWRPLPGATGPFSREIHWPENSVGVDTDWLRSATPASHGAAKGIGEGATSRRLGLR